MAVTRVVVMGVAGAGKTTVGSALARAADVPFLDADTLHSPEAVAKMQSGIPLSDGDRYPWLARVADWAALQQAGCVVACSALKADYRTLLRRHAPDTAFLYLTGSMELAAARAGHRPGHFMPASLVESQFRDLQPLRADERGITIDFALPTDEIVRRFLAWTGGADTASGR